MRENSSKCILDENLELKNSKGNHAIKVVLQRPNLYNLCPETSEYDCISSEKTSLMSDEEKLQEKIMSKYEQRFSVKERKEGGDIFSSKTKQSVKEKWRVLKVRIFDLVLEKNIVKLQWDPTNVNTSRLVGMQYYNKGNIPKAIYYLQIAAKSGTQDGMMIKVV